MTVAEIKRDLPMVKVKYNGNLYWGRVSGRLNKFATVSPYQKIDGKKLISTIIGPCYEFAWETVTRAVNENRVLSVD